MKKVAILFTFFFFFASAGFSQIFDTRNFAINVNVGLVNTFGWGDVKIPPLQASLDYGLFNAGPGTVSLGAQFAFARTYYSKSAINTSIKYHYTYDYLISLLRAGYHYRPGESEKIDLYAGFLVGYNYVLKAKFDIDAYVGNFEPTAPEKSHVLGGVYAGGRYFFTDHIGVNAEIGYGVSVVNVGASFIF